MSGDEEREKKKYNLIRPSHPKYVDEWKQSYRIEKDFVNLHLLYDVEGYQSTACPTVLDIKSNSELLKIQPSETPENVKSKDKDIGVECVSGCVGACVVTGHGFKNCRQETVFEVGNSKSEDNGRYCYPTHEEKLEALWSSRIKENGNVIRDRVHSSPGLPLVCQLMNTLRQTLLLCGVSDKTCQSHLLHVNNESELAVIIMKGLKELACNDQSAIDRFQHILKESLAICNEMIEGGEDGEESSDDTVQFLKALLDVITCMGRERNNGMNELTFDKNCDNLRKRRPALLDDNVIQKRHNIELISKLIKSEIMESTSKKKGRGDLTALQLEFNEEERVVGGILSALVIKEESLLLKEMKMFPHQLYETKATITSATTGSQVYEREGQGKKIKKMKLSRVTREIRARMKRRAELEREEWTEEES